jgi:N-acylglucosamine 2-epimerase
MVLADMTVQLFEYNKDKRYLDILSNVLGKINLHYHPVKEVLMENITTDGSDISEWSKGRNFCPGHSIEVAWIVLGILEHLPDSDTEQKMLSVIENSLELGWDKEFEGIRNFLDIEGKPTLCLENDTKLWWPVAESLYAILAAYKKTGEEKWLNWLDKVHNYTVKHFIDQEYGGWFGFCDKYGNLINTSKGSHSKGFFHTPRSLLNCIKLYS